MNRPPRLSRGTARRLLDGRPAARAREQRLAGLLDALSDRETPGDAAVPAQLLQAFTRHAQDLANAVSARPPAGGRRPARSGARSGPGTRSRRIGRALTVKAAFVLAFSGATVAAAAAADALPAPAQSAAHELLGSWGVPGPSGRVHPVPYAPGTPSASPRPSSAAAVPGSSHAAREGGLSPHAPAFHPAAPETHCAPFEDLRTRGVGLGFGTRVGIGVGDAVGRGCTEDPGGFSGLGGLPTPPATGGEPTKKAPGVKPVPVPVRLRVHSPRVENTEH